MKRTPRTLVQKLGWFAGLWLGGVVSVALVGILIKLLV